MGLPSWPFLHASPSKFRSEPMFDRVRVLGEQRNHKVERVDLSPHALNISLFLTQNLEQVLHGYLQHLAVL